MKIPYQQLSPDALRALIEHFVMGEGTDYGEAEVSLERKVRDVMVQLQEGAAHITYDPETDSCYIHSQSC